MNKTRLFGSIFAAAVLAVFFLACSNPAGPGGNQTRDRQTPPTDDFTPVPPEFDSVADQLEWIRNNGQTDGTYVVWVRDGEDMSAGAAGNINSNIGSTNITVRIRSYGPTTPPPPHELTLCIDNGPGSMFTVQGGHTLYLQDIILTGDNANTASLVTVTGGKLRMQNAVIRNNRAVTGGGVSITNSGTFIMDDGAVIHGNTGTGTWHGGGGVFLDNSTITMNNGAVIHSNHSHDDGGGIVATNNSIVNMNGTARIGGPNGQGNTTNDAGGGLLVTWGSTLNMNGGIIQGNTALRGGGVFVDPHNNPAVNMYANAAVIENQATTYGGGVQLLGILRMRGHNARINNNHAGTNGGGVSGSSGVIRLLIYNGEIYNNTSGSSNAAIAITAGYGTFTTSWSQNGTIGPTSNNIRVSGGSPLP